MGGHGLAAALSFCMMFRTVGMEWEEIPMDGGATLSGE